MYRLLIVLHVIAIYNGTSAIHAVQVNPGAFAKYTCKSKSRRRSSLNGQIVKIMGSTRSENATLINIQSITNPQLTLEVERHQLEAMELSGLVNQSELNGMTIIRARGEIVINEDVPCFRIPVQMISEKGEKEGDPFRVKLQNIKYVSLDILDQCYEFSNSVSMDLFKALWQQIGQREKLNQLDHVFDGIIAPTESNVTANGRWEDIWTPYGVESVFVPHSSDVFNQ